MSFYFPEKPVYLCGPSAIVPTKVITNDDLISWMGATLKGNWVEKRTGIQTRYWVGDEACSDLAVLACKKLLEETSYNKKNIGTLILSTVSGDYPTPPTAPLVQDRLGLENVGAFDLGAACAGFVSGIITGQALVFASNEDILLVSSEIRSKFLSSNDFQTSALFGDGASAVIISSSKDNAHFRFIAGELLSDGSVADIISIPHGGSRHPYNEDDEVFEHQLKMKEGAELFVKALDGMFRSSTLLLEKIEMNLTDIDWIVPHQANLHMITALARKLDFPMAKVVQTIKQWGNTSGASVGMALSYLKNSEDFPIKKGDKVLLISAGGGGLAANAVLEVL